MCVCVVCVGREGVGRCVCMCVYSVCRERGKERGGGGDGWSVSSGRLLCDLQCTFTKYSPLTAREDCSALGLRIISEDHPQQSCVAGHGTNILHVHCTCMYIHVQLHVNVYVCGCRCQIVTSV